MRVAKKDHIHFLSHLSLSALEMEMVWKRTSQIDLCIAIHDDTQYTVHVPMKVVETISWYTVVRAAISHHVHQLPADQKSSFCGVKVLGVLDRQLGIIHPADDFVQVKSRNLLPSKLREYHAILLGPIYKLPEELLQRVLSSYLLTGKEISTLTKINKTFRRLFSSDTVWAKVPFPYEVWRGNGSQGNEEEIWSFMRLQQGLSVMGMYR